MDLLRRILLSAGSAAMLSCVSGPAVTEPPKLIHGGWVRYEMREAGPETLQEKLRTLRHDKIWKATYKGPQDITGIWVLYPGDTVAFEAIQRLNKGPAMRPFTRGPFLVILDTEGVPPQALGDFQEGVAKAIH